MFSKLYAILDLGYVPEENAEKVTQALLNGGTHLLQLRAKGHDLATIKRVEHLLSIAEYKRRQAPIGIRVTHRSFGKDWRYPITSKFRA